MKTTLLVSFLLAMLIFTEAHASNLAGRFEITLGQEKSFVEIYKDKTYKSQNNRKREKVALLNDKNFKYFMAELEKRKSLPSYPVKGCLREKVTLAVSGKTVQSCIKAKNQTAKSLVELSNRLRFLM